MFDTLNQQTELAISAAENLVEQLKQQLKQAQDTLNSLYQQQQLEQTAQGTVQTALDMAHKAYRALDAAYPNNPEAISEFEQAFLALNYHPQSELVESETIVEDNIIDVTTTENSNGNGNGHHTSAQLSDHSTQSVDTESLDKLGVSLCRSDFSLSAATELVEVQSKADLPYLLPVAGESTDPSTEILSVDELKVLPRDTLHILCDRYCVSKNGNRLHIAKRLEDKVTRRNVTTLTNT